MRILHVVGARPNFPKLAPVFRQARAVGVDQVVVHTGQHYDHAMSSDFFRDLGLRPPDINLEVGSATHAVQTARVMERFEPVLLQQRPDWTVVYGDVNSTVAAALVAAKLGFPVAHVEAGVRSGDRAMPEEINRIVTDRLADLLLTPSRAADATLRSEGEPESKIAFVGNVMVDALQYALQRARATGFRRSLGLSMPPVTVTLHRPSNVDDPARLREVVTGHPKIGDFFESVLAARKGDVAWAKRAANFVMTEVLADVALRGLEAKFPVSPAQVVGILELVDTQTISGKQAKEVYAGIKGTGTAAHDFAARQGIAQVSDSEALEKACCAVIEANPKQVAAYRGGKAGTLGFFVGLVMKATKGSANPALVNELLKRFLA